MSSTDNSKRNNSHLLRGRGTLVIGALLIGLVAFFLGFSVSPDAPSTPAGEEHAHESGGQTEDTVWTCSMHPQIKLPKPGKCPICFMDLIPVENGSDGQTEAPILKLSETAKQIARIETAPVRRAYQTAKVDLTGKITVDETRLAKVTARFPGRIDRLYADYSGMRIDKGESLADIYSPELISAQQELIQATKFLNQLPDDASPTLAKTAGVTVQAVREKLRQWGLTDGQIDAIEGSDEYYEHLTISSPMQGTILEKNVVEGDYVKTGMVLYRMADLRKLWVMLEAYESDIIWITEGQTVTFTVKAFPGREFEGKIDFIEPTVESGSRTVQVRAVIDNTKRLLKPDMFVSATVQSHIDKNGHVIIGRRQKNADLNNAPLLIPASAPLITGKRAVVYVATDGEDGTTYEGREVILGPRAGDFYVVEAGLGEGEQVVVNGAFKIDSELQIQAKPSMMSPDDEKAIPITTAPQQSPYAMEAPDSDTNMTFENRETILALTPVYDAYFILQMALANDSLDAAISSYNDLVERIKGIDMELFSMSGHQKWMEYSSEMLKQAKRGGKAEDIETARDAFYYLSKTVLDMHDAFGHASEEKYFLTFCPMARNNSGAHWLQKANIVWNSFYGHQMLRCGEIQDSTESIFGEGN